MFCGAYVCILQYHRYLANPIVLTVEREFNWTVTLPSITFCYGDNLSPDNVNDFITATWNISANFEHHEKYLYYREFLSSLLSLNIYNLAELLPYLGDPSLEDLDFLATIASVLPEHDHYVSSFLRDTDLPPQTIVTEHGICYTVNSLGLNKASKPVQCDEDQCFLKLDIFGFNTSVAVHSFHEPILYESFFYDLHHEDELTVTFRLLETINDGSVRDLTFAQRKCRFYHEVEDRPSAGEEESLYSVNSCLLKCRAQMAIKLCGCKPHFYSYYGELSM